MPTKGIAPVAMTIASTGRTPQAIASAAHGHDAGGIDPLARREDRHRRHATRSRAATARSTARRRDDEGGEAELEDGAQPGDHRVAGEWQAPDAVGRDGDEQQRGDGDGDRPAGGDVHAATVGCGGDGRGVGRRIRSRRVPDFGYAVRSGRLDPCVRQSTAPATGGVGHHLASSPRTGVHAAEPDAPRDTQPGDLWRPGKRSIMHTFDDINSASLRSDVPDFRAGDTLRVHVKVVEGTRSRVQVFQGIVIRRHGGGVGRDLHRPQDLLRCRRRAHLPGPHPDHRPHRGHDPR